MTEANQPGRERVALVTGSAKRMGKAIVEMLAAEGVQVIVHYRSSLEEAEAVVARVIQNGGNAYALQADLTQAQQAEQLVGEVIRRSGRLDILINNVGNYLWKSIESTTLEEWESMLQGTVNLTYYMCRVALPQMKKQGWGRVINLGDARADHLQAWPECTPYMIGKTGVLLLTKSLAASYGAYGVTINCIAPGVMNNSIDLSEHPLEEIPAGRYGKYADILHAIRFLIQEEAAYVNGANLKVDGGWMP